MVPRARAAFSRWRSRRSRPSRAARTAWSLGLLTGGAAWTWLVHGWAEAYGHDRLLAGWPPWYLMAAALTYWPLACLLWWAMYPGSGFAPWDRSDT